MKIKSKLIQIEFRIFSGSIIDENHIVMDFDEIFDPYMPSHVILVVRSQNAANITR